MARKVFVILSNCYAYDDESYYPTGEQTVNQVFARKKDAKDAVERLIIHDVQDRNKIDRVLCNVTLHRDRFETLAALIEPIYLIWLPGEKDWFHILGVKYDFDPSVLTEDQARTIARLADYCPYVIQETAAARYVNLL